MGVVQKLDFFAVPDFLIKYIEIAYITRMQFTLQGKEIRKTWWKIWPESKARKRDLKKMEFMLLHYQWHKLL